LGIVFSIGILVLGGTLAIFAAQAGAATIAFGIIALILSAVAIFAGIIIKKRTTLGKILLLAIGIVLLIFSLLPFVGLLLLVPAILILIGGILGFARKEQPSVAA
ncbi:MAG: hypothetical protein GX369_08185, partial [Euryarchaeota archaeon]|nr:hypothetical protein [Euryarchaeota archaeon]